jgi:hypothetical protein
MGAEMSQYIYHLERAKLYFGRFNTSTSDIEYELDLNNLSNIAIKPPAVSGHVDSKIGEVTSADLDPPIDTIVNVSADASFIFD